MHETQKSISTWASATFGEVGSNALVVARANREMGELLSALAADDNHPQAAEEAADVAIVLYRYFDRCGETQPVNVFRPIEGVSNFSAAADANDHLAYALRLLGRKDDSRDAILHCGAVLDRLAGIVERLGSNLQAEIDRKMAINRKRKWVLRGDGTGQHAGGHYGNGSQHIEGGGHDEASA